MKIRLSIILLIQLLFIQSAFSSTVVVDQLGNGDYTTISEAVEELRYNSGSSIFDTIRIKPGFYIESLKLNSFQTNIAVIGDGPEVVTVFNSSNSLEILSFNYGTGRKLSVENIHFSSNNGNSANVTSNSDANEIFITNCKFSGYASFSYNNNVKIYSCIFTDTFNSNRNASLTIGNALFFNTGAQNNYGIFVVGNGDYDTNIYNSIIYGYQYGVVVDGGNFLSLYNLFYNNTYLSNPSNVLSSDDIINVDPLFIDNETFLLSSSSPCIDAGIPIQAFNDLDGSRNDIGLHGGPYAPYGLGPVITNISATPNPVNIGQTITIEATGTAE